MRAFPLFLFACSCVHAEKSYHGYTVYRIIPNDSTELSLLKTLATKYDVWNEAGQTGQPCDVMVDGASRPIIEEWLEGKGMKYQVMIDDVGDLVDLQASDRGNRPSMNSFDYSTYHTLEEIEAWIDDTAAAYSQLVEVEEVARSFEGRPIRVMKISTEPDNFDKPAIWWDSAMRGREWIGPAAVLFMTNELLRLYGSNDDVTNILDNFDIYVLPVFNPDGYEFTWTTDRFWRKTRSINIGSSCRGSDPNRNTDILFGEIGSSTEPCSDSYPGSEAFSEVEVREIVNYISQIPELRMYLSYHSYGQRYMFPFGFTPEVPPDYDDLMSLCTAGVAAIAHVYGRQYLCASLSHVLYPSSGSCVDYIYAVLKVKYSYQVYLRGSNSFLPPDQIIPTAEENFAGFIAMATELLYRN